MWIFMVLIRISVIRGLICVASMIDLLAET
jgi:hypothetical protein